MREKLPTQEVFDRVLLRPVEPDEAGLAHLSWTAREMSERAVQVYVNGRLYDIVTDRTISELWLHLDRTAGTRVELLAVDVRRAWESHVEHLGGWSPGFVTEARLGILREEGLPVDGRVGVEVDGEADAGHRLWGPSDSRAGFGALLGLGPFGWDEAAALGLGLGEFGAGGFGIDGTAWGWRRDDLGAGTHRVKAYVTTAEGVRVGETQEQQVAIEALPEAAADVTVDGKMTLHW